MEDIILSHDIKEEWKEVDCGLYSGIFHSNGQDVGEIEIGFLKDTVSIRTCDFTSRIPRRYYGQEIATRAILFAYDIAKARLEALCQGGDYTLAQMSMLFHFIHHAAEPEIQGAQDDYIKFLSVIKDAIFDICINHLKIEDPQVIGFILTNTLDEIETSFLGEPSGLNPF